MSLPPRSFIHRRKLAFERLEGRKLLASISGTVFRDQNQDGKRNPGEPPIPGWQTYLDENGNGQYDKRAHTAVFHSTDVPVDLPDLTDVTSYIDVPQLDTVVGHVTVTLDITHDFVRDFSIYLVSPREELYSILFRHFEERGGNNLTNTTLDDDAEVNINHAEAPYTGVFQPSNSFAGLNGKSAEGRWGLRIWDDRTGAAGTLNSWSIAITTGEPLRTADANGAFAFDDLPAGEHRLRQFDYPTWLKTRPAAGHYDVQLAADQDFAYAHFGADLPTSSISGVKFHDLNANGARDADEPVLAGWSVYLDLNRNNQRDAGEPLRVTDADGRYLFNHLDPGNYVVREIVPFGWKGLAENPSAGQSPAATSAAAAPSAVTTSTPRSPPAILSGRNYAPDRVIVTLRRGLPASEATALRQSVGARLQRRLDSLDVEIWNLPPGASVAGVIERIWSDPRLTGIEPDYEVQGAAVVPNDPDFSQLSNFINGGEVGTGPHINAPEAWETTTGNRAVTVAVIDSGVDYTHPDLVNNIWTNWGELPGNGIDDDGNGYVDDVHGYDFFNDDSDPMDDWFHGTHIAGTIAAEGNNGQGVAGVNWHASIMALKFLNSTGHGSNSGALAALDYSITMGVRVTNNSYGNFDYTPMMIDVFQRGLDANQLEVFAAGNLSSNIDLTPFWPASYPAENLIVVAASRKFSDGVAYFSNRGAIGVDLAAPGEEVYSLGLNHGYRLASGTSMAAPHVTGVAALLLAKNPTLTWQQLKDAILSSVDVRENFTHFVATGGTLNAARALASVPAFDAPVVHLDPGSNPVEIDLPGRRVDPPVIADAGAAATYIENSAPIPLLADTVTVSDADSPHFAGGRLTVTITANSSADDRLAIRVQGVQPGQIGLSGRQVTFGGLPIGVVTGGWGETPVIVSLKSNATSAAVQALLKSLTFRTLSDAPSMATRTVTLVLTDGSGGTSSVVQKAVNVVAVNDAPILDTNPSPTLPKVAEDTADPAGSVVATLLQGAITDPDADARRGIAVSAASNFNGVWQYSLNGGATWVGMGEPAVSAALLLPGWARVRFVPKSDFHGVVKLYFHAWDQTQGAPGDRLDLGRRGGTTALSSSWKGATLTVTSVNDPPRLSLSESIRYVRDSAPVQVALGATIADIDSNNFDNGFLRVQITDGASSSNRLSIGAGFTVDVSNNVLKGAKIIGQRTANGAGAKSLVIRFNASATPFLVQQLVRSITYQSVGGAAGKRTVLFTVSDGDGGLNAEATMTVDVS